MMPNDELDVIWGAKQVAETLRLSRRRAVRLIKAREIPGELGPSGDARTFKTTRGLLVEHFAGMKRPQP